MMKKFAALSILVISLALTSTAFATVDIQLAHTGSLDHQYNIGAQAFKKFVEERSHGEMKVTIFPQAQLGSEREECEGVRMGTLNMTILSVSGALPNWVPEMQVLEAIPFLFENRKQVYGVLDGPFGQKLSGIMEAKGFKNLGYMEVGFRNFTTGKKPVRSPADLAGMKIRVQESKIWMEFIKALGAIPTPVPFDELYSALQQGVVDGEENPIPTVMSMKFYEVQKCMTLDRHTYTACAVLANPKWFSKLTAEQQKLISEAVKDAVVEQRKTLESKEVADLQKLKASGVTVIENPDHNAFVKATKDMDKVFATIVPGGETIVKEMKDAVAAVK